MGALAPVFTVLGPVLTVLGPVLTALVKVGAASPRPLMGGASVHPE